MTDESEIEALKHYDTKFSHLDGGSLGIPPMTNRVRLSSGKRHGRPRNRTLGINMNTRKDEPKNMAKYEAYKLAFGQINAALKAGFPIEAIALEESIISDRLESAAVGKGISLKKRPAGRTADFSELAGLVETNAEFRGLAEALEKAGFSSGSLAAWRKSRNDFIHNVAHGAPRGVPAISASEYKTRGAMIAKNGLKLARLVCAWSKKELAGKPVEAKRPR